MSVRNRVTMIVIAALALATAACNFGGDATTATSAVLPATMTPDTSQTQTGVVSNPSPEGPTQMPICTPPACPSGQSIICQQAQGCPLGCGVVCGAPSATPATGPTATTFTVPNAPAANAEFEGIAFHFEPGLTPEWKVEIVPNEPNPAGAPESWLLPSHYAFTFAKYPVSNTYQPPRILVFPIKNFEGYNQPGLDEINLMKQVLAEKPASFDPNRGIPVIPIFNAAQVFRTHVVYMAFQNGTGMRFVTQYDQYPPPINNAELFYTYQGVTNDGLYYVAAFFPVSHPSLPADASNPDPIVGSDFNSYLAGVQATLDAAADSSFTPDLRVLDQMMQSLTVK